MVIRSDDEIGDVLAVAKLLAVEGLPALVKVRLAKTDFPEGPLIDLADAKFEGLDYETTTERES